MQALSVSAESLPGLLLRKGEKLKQTFAEPVPIRDIPIRFRGRVNKGPIKKRTCPPSADCLRREAVAIDSPSTGWKISGN